MSNTMSRWLAAAVFLVVGAAAILVIATPNAARAFTASSALSRAVPGDGIVRVQHDEQKSAMMEQQQKKKQMMMKKKQMMMAQKKKQMMMMKKQQAMRARMMRPPRFGLSRQQQQQLREQVPEQYRQYLPPQR
jgi:fructose-1,6-bisphosphatase